MRDLYTTTVVDRLEWLHVQLQQNTVFSTTDHLSYVLKNVFYLWECEFIILLSLSVETEVDSSGIVRANASKIPAKLEEQLFSQIDSIKSPRLLLGQETLYTNRNIAKLRTLASNVKRYSPLQPREAFVGGRIENFVTK